MSLTPRWLIWPLITISVFGAVCIAGRVGWLIHSHETAAGGSVLRASDERAVSSMPDTMLKALHLSGEDKRGGRGALFGSVAYQVNRVCLREKVSEKQLLTWLGEPDTCGAGTTRWLEFRYKSGGGGNGTVWVKVAGEAVTDFLWEVPPTEGGKADRLERSSGSEGTGSGETRPEK